MRQTGLTLLELIVVMAIMGVVMALVGLPLFGQRVSLKVLSRHTRTLMALARTVAMTHGVTEHVQIDPHTRTLNLGGALSARQLHIGALTVPHSVRVTVTAQVPHGPHGSRRFRFYADGSATPGRVIFHRNGHQVVVTVGLFSHAR